LSRGSCTMFLTDPQAPALGSSAP